MRPIPSTTRAVLQRRRRSATRRRTLCLVGVAARAALGEHHDTDEAADTLFVGASGADGRGRGRGRGAVGGQRGTQQEEQCGEKHAEEEEFHCGGGGGGGVWDGYGGGYGYGYGYVMLCYGWADGGTERPSCTRRMAASESPLTRSLAGWLALYLHFQDWPCRS